MPRRVTPELMDDPAVDQAQLDNALAYIRNVNRWLGGHTAMLKPLQRWSRAWKPKEAIHLLDIGAGSADLPITAVRWANQAGFNLRVTAVDLHERTLDAAQRQINASGIDPAQIELVHADATTLTNRYQDNRFDYVHAGMFIHHLPNEVVILTALAIMDRLASRGVIWNDLLRSAWSKLGVRIITVGASPMVKHDATVSVEAGFTKAEALDLATRAGLHKPRAAVQTIAGRFVLTAEQPIPAPATNTPA